MGTLHRILLFILLVVLTATVQAGMVTGTYTGDGNATQGITGLGGTPDVLLVKEDGSSQAWIATSTMPAGEVKDLTQSNSGLSSGLLTSLDADGFTVGNSTISNESGVTYYYVAWDADSELDVGTFVPGSAGAYTETLGYRPSMVWCFGEGTDWYEVHPGQFIMDGQSSTSAFTFNSGGAISTASYKLLSSIDATGFTTTAATTSASHSGPNVGTTYHYVAFNPGSNGDFGQYSGDNSTPQDVSVGVTPDFVMVKNTAGSDNTWFKTVDMAATESFKFTGASAIINITGVSDSPNQFSVGTSGEVNGSNSYDYFTVGALATLPVELISFNGHKTDDGNLLTWKTSAEVNSSHFYVERAFNGEDFEIIGTIMAAGTSTEVLDYSFLDDYPSDRNNFYRLVQVDFDGTHHYKKMIVINGASGNKVTRAVAYEVIGGSEINFEYTGTANLNKIEVYNELGAIIYGQVFGQGVNSVKKSLLLDDLSKGVYFVKFYHGTSGVQTTRFVKTR